MNWSSTEVWTHASLRAIHRRMPLFCELVKSLRVVFHAISKWYVQSLLLYLKRATVEYSGFSVRHVMSEYCTPVQKFSLDSCLSEALSSRLSQEGLPRHSYMDMEGTSSLIFLSSLPLRSWTLSHSFLVNFLSHIRAYQPHPHGIITAS